MEKLCQQVYSLLQLKVAHSVQANIDELSLLSSISAKNLQIDESVILEERLKPFHTFVDDEGHVYDARRHKILVTFAHFVYLASDRKYVVTNLQGSVSGNTYTLTNALFNALHTDIHIYPNSGLNHFKHICNLLCENITQYTNPRDSCVVDGEFDSTIRATVYATAPTRETQPYTDENEQQGLAWNDPPPSYDELFGGVS